MDVLHDAVETRVIAALVEKEFSTPDYYPMTLNALTAACNQKSNRAPVVEFDEKTVARALENLRERGLSRVISGADIRVPKYSHRLPDIIPVEPALLAVLCELMLRGPQTVGELRGRCSRLHEFTDLAAVEAVLERLVSHAEGPLVCKLPRQPGRKESRYAHLLAGEPELPQEEQREAPVEAATLAVRAENERLAALETQVELLQQQMAELRQQFTVFKEQFE